MSSPQYSPTPPHQYPQAIQLKLYQAFIFSIPILFSIILFLLFYLFYLKRRASTLSVLPRTINITTPLDSDLKNELKNKLCTVLFDECMKARDSLCCVCLGEFELKEELLQVTSCKHMFHIECIQYWLHNNSTCPLCRAPVVSHNNINSKSHHPTFPSNLTPHHHQVVLVVAPPPSPPPQQQQQQQQQLQHCITPLEGSSSGSGTGSGSSC